MKKIRFLLLALPLIIVGCGEKKPDPEPEPCKHEFDSALVYDDTNHWKVCKLCQEKVDLETHTILERTTKEAKCEEAGEKERYCSKCGYSKKETIDALGHQYSSPVVTKPTAIAEGKLDSECSRCHNQISKKILKLPESISMDGNVISWSEVENAQGYVLKLGEEEIDVGGLTSYTIEDVQLIKGTVQVYAYTLDDSYVMYDGETTKENFTVCKDNIQSAFNSDFENNSRIRLNRIGGWNNYPYGNWSDINTDSGLGGHYYIDEEPDGNMAAKVPAVVWWRGNTTLKRDLGSGCWAPGNYEISFDIKASEASLTYHNGANYGTIKGYMWDSKETVNAITIGSTGKPFDGDGGGLVVKDIPGISTTAYTNVRLRYALYSAVTFNQFNLIYWPEQDIGEENFIMIDNIQVFKISGGVVGTENVDNNLGGDFEAWNQSNMSENMWYANNTILPENNALGSSIEKETSGNQSLKILSKEGETAQINLAGNPTELGKGGVFEMSLDAKKNANLDSADFKFQMWGFKAGQAVDLTGEVVMDIGEITADEYKAIKLNFVINPVTDLDAVNIFITVNFNNSGDKANSYIFIDNVEIHKIVLGGDSNMNVLFIGNSFMDDTIEYTYKILENLDVDTSNINIYGLFFGSCSIEQHYNFLSNNYANYDLRAYNRISQSWYNKIPLCSLRQALALHSDWDVISFQQSSAGFDDFAKFEKLPLLAAAVRNIVGPDTSFVFNGTWAYREDAPEITSQGYNTQLAMYNKIIQTEQILMGESYSVKFDKLIPSTTSIQNGRQVYGQGGLNRDDRHLSFGLGRFIASLTMVEVIFEIDINEVTFKPEGVSDEDLDNSKLFVKSAIANPYELMAN